IWQETWRIVNYSRNDEKIFLCILGISWFWMVGATFLSQFAPYVKDVIHAEPDVVTLFLTVFSVGIGVGSFLCNKILRGSIQSTFVPLAALGITIFGVDLYFASGFFEFSETSNLISFWQFIEQFASWRILFDLFMIAVCGGIYIVPLYAMIQHLSEATHLARNIAANNIVNAIFMVASALITLLMLSLSFSIPQVFLSIALLNGLVAIYICQLLPDALLRSIIRAFLSFFYRVELKGIENYTQAGKRVLIIANHTSFLDAALIAAYLPEKITFAINTYIARKWWMKPLLVLVNAFPLDPTNPLATKSLIDVLKKDNKCMIFPEGRITVTGSLMKIYEGPGMIADKSGAKLLPIRIEGAQYTPFSYLKGKVKIRWFPKITLTILPAHNFNISEEIKGRKRRAVASAQLYDVMSQMMFESSNYKRTLFTSLVNAKEIHGRNHIIVEDVDRKPLSYGNFLIKAFVLGRALNRLLKQQKNVGILLPNAIINSLIFFALQIFYRTPAMMNFTAGAAQMLIACKTANIKTIITSKRFVKNANLDNIVKELSDAGIEIIYLEEFRKKITIIDNILGIIASFFPKITYNFSQDSQTPAVILFTSGSEGTPKGVVLSHENILANISQLASRIDFGPQDKVFNCLPMFHSFGLTAGTLLPILSGIKTFYYPSPLHYRIVPELIYDTDSTIMFGTDTFLSGYARFANSYDFHSVRYIFAGAEKLKEETRKNYAEKFNVSIFEGYGATETSPVMSINTPMQNRIGTVGRLMPSIEYRLENVEGITEGGKLQVKGPNIMLGYLRAENPGVLEALNDGWYDTGDIVSIDSEGYITIKGRTKRFAKIGGEMVSLTAVETAINNLWAGQMNVVVTIPDDKKGEQIILITEYENANRDEIIKYFRSEKINELAIPKKIINKPVPLLGTGKIDYQ
ncbi:MAG: acyl-[ACP]--phospholipid O-acyltransferase, partial [Pseudomonadota bacterium]